MSIVDSYTNEIMVMIISSGAEEGKYTFNPYEYMYSNSEYRQKLLKDISKYCHITGQYDAYKDFGIYTITDNNGNLLSLQSNTIEYIMKECLNEGINRIEDLPSTIVGSMSNDSKIFRKKRYEYKKQLKEYNYHNEKKYWYVERVEGMDSALSPVIHTTFLSIDKDGKYEFPKGMGKDISLFFETEKNMKKIVEAIYDNYKENYIDEEFWLNKKENEYTKRFDYCHAYNINETHYNKEKYYRLKDIIGEESDEDIIRNFHFDISDYKSCEEIINPTEDDNCTGLLIGAKYEYTQNNIDEINIKRAKAEKDTDMLLDGEINRDNYLAVWDDKNNKFGVGKFDFRTIYTLNIANPDKDRRVYTLKELRELSHKNTDIEFNKVEKHIEKYHKEDDKE